MKIAVLNGSPKGNNSVTLQSVKYLQKNYDHIDFEIYNVATQIKGLESEEKFRAVWEGIDSADFVLVSYPVYTFLAPSQLHRFFELMSKYGVSFDGKYVTQFTTSKRFYDVTAHGTVKRIIQSLGGKYIDGLSADMEDLLAEKGREELLSWWDYTLVQADNGVYCIDSYEQKVPSVYERQLPKAEKKKGKKVIIVTDTKDNPSLNNMVADFVDIFPYEIRILDLNELELKSGCIGCLKCATDGTCVIKDGFSSLLNDVINKADAVIMAFGIQNHAVSALYKKYYDRQFCNGHRPVTAGKPTGYIVSGALSTEPVLLEYIDAKSAVGGNPNCGIVCDEKDTAENIKNLSFRLSYALNNELKLGTNFYEVGGMKIFRDMIWIMRGIMKADYDFYKKNGLLDFPQKKRGTMIAMKLVGKLLKSKAINKKMPNMMNEGMLMSYKKYTD